MTDPNLERLLADALDARARAAVGDTSPPPPRYAADTGAARALRHGTSARRRMLAPLLAAAAVAAAVVGSLAAAGQFSHSPGAPVAAGSVTSSQPSTAVSATPVDVRMQPLPSNRVGVGMPVVAYFSRRFPSAAQWQRATTVLANGHRLDAAWYFVRSTQYPGYPIAGHLRPRHFWPAHATISVRVAGARLPAGPGYAFADSVSAAFRTGPALVATVDSRDHQLSLTRDGSLVDRCSVSLGADRTPTTRGIKVVMAKAPDRSLTGPGYAQKHVKDVQQLTDNGEYLLAAPWMTFAIDKHLDLSGGSTDLRPTDAHRLYQAMHVGDVVRYPDAAGPRMRMSEGYGDWNVPWRHWLTGGLIPTR